MPPARFILASVVAAVFITAAPPASAQTLISQHTGAEVDLVTGLITKHRISRPGLEAVINRPKHQAIIEWRAGDFRPTITINDQILIDGADTNDVSRIGSFRLRRDGSYAYVRTTKTRGDTTDIVQDGDTVISLPYGTQVSIIEFNANRLITSRWRSKELETLIELYAVGNDGRVAPSATHQWRLVDCATGTIRIRQNTLFAEAYCNHTDKPQLISLPLQPNAKPQFITGSEDVFIWGSGPKDQPGVRALKLEGSPETRAMFHALAGLTMGQLGEPRALASDEAGTLSWSQSYRLRALALLYQKTGDEVFALLEAQAIDRILGQTNHQLQITADHGLPAHGWATRIYSSNQRTPIAHAVNLGMIGMALIEACGGIEEYCDPALMGRLEQSARSIIRFFSAQVDADTGLYLIPANIPFRFAGEVAPWNWQMAMAGFLAQAGQMFDQSSWTGDANKLVTSFLSSHEVEEGHQLWRYWPARTSNRFEDVSHAGISILGLASAGHQNRLQASGPLSKTLTTVASQGFFPARDIDGEGPRDPRWLPAGGWAHLDNKAMKHLFASRMPGWNAADTLFSYAVYAKQASDTRLTLHHQHCSQAGCTTNQVETISDLTAFMLRRRD
ncbi:MAG: hypothetical protein KI792_08420 [Alphaproteobacteria bacterium]|nr:hypothetical protein [Alphaproteobacteria bacterium SS10]